MTPESCTRSEAEGQSMIRGMALEELREALDVTQAQRAARLTVNQSAISRLDRLNDMYVGTLRNVIAAMGGKLEIRAVFPEGQVAAVN